MVRMFKAPRGTFFFFFELHNFFLPSDKRHGTGITVEKLN